MQVGLPSGKNSARFRRDKGGSIMKTNTIFAVKVWRGLTAVETESKHNQLQDRLPTAQNTQSLQGSYTVFQ
jgi:hypothetical protein